CARGRGVQLQYFDLW
nr:immunoglobulin heavy chain junction region [Macaca mulatta]MOX01518.1 immunoglobulin heavy chain junction region [Macaca mulatta]MOX03239.1 immunoglobulin heavy chain junction region [Macaca mulatta]MOX37839.1 immunoglobulin heavy chain junction region [Macaca mulatta]MOX38034.1 immunoglobulin heavy chain junction region [Macaca mulatta]